MGGELLRYINGVANAPPQPEVPRAFTLAPPLPFDDIWTPEPDLNLVVPGFGICPGPVHLVTGSWYTGKTLFLMTLGFAVASGRDLFGLWRVQRGRWRHLDHEMGRRGIKRYAQRIREGLGVDVADLRGTMDIHPLPTLNLCTPEALDLYTELLQGCSICTIDPLRAAAPGQDENSSEYRQWLDMLAVVSDRTGCAIVLLHHGGKPAEGSKRRNTGRGSSAIDDAAQSKIVLTVEEKGEPIQVSHEKTRELSQPLEDFWLEVMSGPSWVRLEHRNAEQMEGAVETKRARKEMAAIDRAKAGVRAAIAKYAGQFRGSRNELVTLVGGDRTMVQRAISGLVAASELRSEGRGDDRVWSVV